MITRTFRSKRRRGSAPLVLVGALVVAAIMAATGQALVSDSGTVDVQVPNKTQSVVDATTAQGAFVSYFGDSDSTFGASGTGLFDPFVRIQGSPTEQGYNTNGTVEFNTKVGNWTHAIKVSQIPQRPCPQSNPTLRCFELFNDINEGNNAKHISLNTVQVFYTDNPNLTGYASFSSSPPAGTTKEYEFNGDIEINDVNQGSGRGDLRYDIPITGLNGVPLPPNCNYGNPLCNTYFLLYSKWGTTSATYNSDGGFEEWKVKIYPVPVTTSASSAQNWLPNDTATITSAGGQALNGTLTIALYTEGTCGVGTGSAVSGQSYPFTLTNEASGTAHSTTNTTYKVSATSTVSWLVTFNSTDPNVESTSHCESTALTITN
jgi:hypothetical protein